jgi:Flp pilus assembly pilin Flp
MSCISAFLKENTGTTAIEYALIFAGVSAIIIAALNRVGIAIVVKLLMTGLIFFEGAPTP